MHSASMTCQYGYIPLTNFLDLAVQCARIARRDNTSQLLHDLCLCHGRDATLNYNLRGTAAIQRRGSVRHSRSDSHWRLGASFGTVSRVLDSNG